MSVQLLIVIGVGVMLLLAVSIVLFVVMYQRSTIHHHLELKKINSRKELELIQASIQSEEEERNRIAAELHDDVVATLASARLFLYKPKDGEYGDEAIDKAKTLLDESIGKIRNISHKLQPATLQQLGLERSLQAMVEAINMPGVVNVQYRNTTPLPRVADHAELAAYRIQQELITNILKHSEAKNISLATDVTATGLQITLTHNGAGMSQEMYEEQIFKRGATGLKNIVNRLKSVDANIQFRKIDENLFTTILNLPFSETAKS